MAIQQFLLVPLYYAIMQYNPFMERGDVPRYFPWMEARYIYTLPSSSLRTSRARATPFPSIQCQQLKSHLIGLHVPCNIFIPYKVGVQYLI